MTAPKRVLVFDSGVGGLSVLDAIVRGGGPFSLDYLADNAWLPYGAKPDADIRARAPALIAAVAREWEPDAVVIACNTASTIALEDVRARLDVPVVGVVPPVKPAAARTRTGVIGLLATPATIARPYTDDLIARFASGVRVLRFGSTALVAQAEAKLAGQPVDPRAIVEAIDGLFAAPGGAEIDVVALACTHFPLLAEELASAAPRAVTWLDSGDAVAARLRDVTSVRDADGLCRLRRAAFTAPPGLIWDAFEARGFSGQATVNARFDVAPVPDRYG